MNVLKNQDFLQKIPQELLELHEIFSRNSLELYLVGGAVRNLVLGLEAKDWDCATNAPPERVMEIFRKVIPTGIAHGTVTVLHKGMHFEVTTFRLDGSYTDSRRPDTVTYTEDIIEDLSRRDFTMNAMAIHLGSGELLDPFGGRGDLNHSLIRTVGDPLLRFDEDGLRIARALRFAAQLNFRIHEATWDAISPRLHKLEQVSVERCRDEFLKTLFSPHPSLGLRYFAESGALACFLPELAKQAKEYFTDASGPSQLDITARIRKSLTTDHVPTILSALCLQIINEEVRVLDANKVYGNLKLPVRIMSETRQLLENINPLPLGLEDPVHIRGRIARVGKNLYPHLLTLHLAIMQTRLELIPSTYFDIQTYLNLANTIIDSKPACSIGELAIDGSMLMVQLGIKPGKEIGLILNHLVELVIKDPLVNTKDTLLEFATKYYTNHILKI